MPWDRRVLPLTIEQIVDLYVEQGESTVYIANLCGIGYARIVRELREAGIQLRPRGPSARGKKLIGAARASNLPEDQLRELAAMNLSTREMAAMIEGGRWSEECVREAMVRLGIDRLPGKARPDHNFFWKGGLTVDKHGYILEKAPDHPESSSNGYVRQHRIVMERELGRPLLSGEVVDHRNGDTSDNRPENLRLFSSNGEHLRVTRTGRPRLSREERAALTQEAVLRAKRRVAAILAESENGAGPSPE